jgi:hypothetical protein
VYLIEKLFQEDYSPLAQIPEQSRPRRLINYPAVRNFNDVVQRPKSSRPCLHCLGRSDKISKSNMEPFPLSEWTAVQRRGRPPA